MESVCAELGFAARRPPSPETKVTALLATWRRPLPPSLAATVVKTMIYIVYAIPGCRRTRLSQRAGKLGMMEWMIGQALMMLRLAAMHPRPAPTPGVSGDVATLHYSLPTALKCVTLLLGRLSKLICVAPARRGRGSRGNAAGNPHTQPEGVAGMEFGKNRGIFKDTLSAKSGLGFPAIARGRRTCPRPTGRLPAAPPPSTMACELRWSPPGSAQGQRSNHGTRR